MNRSRIVLLAAIVACTPRIAKDAPKPTPQPPPTALEVTYLGNEGFLVETPHASVLVDALYRKGVSGYPVIEPALREKVERAQPPFHEVQLVLATHWHDDHFDAEAVTKHLQSNPRAMFVSTPEAMARLQALGASYDPIRERTRGFWPRDGIPESVAHAGVTVRVHRMHHGQGARPAQNLGFVVDLEGRRILHVGDTAMRAEELRALGLGRERIEIAFIPYWHFDDDAWRAALIDSIRPQRIVAMHFPLSDAPRDYFDESGTLDGTRKHLAEKVPGIVMFDAPLEKRTF